MAHIKRIDLLSTSMALMIKKKLDTRRLDMPIGPAG